MIAIIYLSSLRMGLRCLLLLMLVGFCLAKPAVMPWSRLFKPEESVPSEGAFDIRSLWKKFIDDFKQSIGPFSFKNFEQNVLKIWQHFKVPSSYSMAINKFAALVSCHFDKVSNVLSPSLV